MRTIPFLSFVAACMFFSATSAQSKEYIIGVEELDYYPLYFYEDGDYKGYARYVMDRFEEHSGHTFVYKPYPVKRLILEFLDGNLDFKFPATPEWDADKKVNFDITYSVEVMGYTNGVMVRAGEAGQGTLEKLGTLRGFTITTDYDADFLSGKTKRVELNSLKQLFSMLGLGRVDGIYFNTAVANYYQSVVISQPGMAVFDPVHPHVNGSYHLSTIKHPEIIEEFNQFIAAGIPGYEEFVKERFSTGRE